MTGPEHYHEAEVLAECAAREMDSGADLRAEATLQLGQLHATLALAAATALGLDQLQDDHGAWRSAASEQPAAERRRREAALAEQAEWEAAEHAAGGES